MAKESHSHYFIVRSDNPVIHALAYAGLGQDKRIHNPLPQEIACAKPDPSANAPLPQCFCAPQQTTTSNTIVYGFCTLALYVMSSTSRELQDISGMGTVHPFLSILKLASFTYPENSCCAYRTFTPCGRSTIL